MKPGDLVKLVRPELNLVVKLWNERRTSGKFKSKDVGIIIATDGYDFVYVVCNLSTGWIESRHLVKT